MTRMLSLLKVSNDQSKQYAIRLWKFAECWRSSLIYLFPRNQDKVHDYILNNLDYYPFFEVYRIPFSLTSFLLVSTNQDKVHEYILNNSDYYPFFWSISHTFVVNFFFNVVIEGFFIINQIVHIL